MVNDSFFAKARPSTGKRKRPGTLKSSSKAPPKNPKSQRRARDGEEDEDEDDAGMAMQDAFFDSGDEGNLPVPGSEDDKDDDRETAAQKRLRLAKAYLDTLKRSQQAGEGQADAAELDRDLIAERLHQDVLERSGDMHVFLADRLAAPTPADLFYTSSSKAHRLTVTAAVADRDGHHLYSASKDGSVSKWDLHSALSDGTPSIHRLVYCPKHVRTKATSASDVKGKEVDRRTATIGHSGEILSLSLSDDGHILASGSTDRLVGVWDVSEDGCRWRGGLRGHKDTISAVVFRTESTQVYTAAYDRTLKIFDLSTLSYIETLFGHQDRIMDLACLRNETPISAGGRDKSLRFWKVAEENQLVFRGGGTSRLRDVIEGAAVDEDIHTAAPDTYHQYIEASTDCVAMIDDGHFLSGGDSGSICLWTVTRKKPIFTRPVAHGLEDHMHETEGLQRRPRSITALACLPYGDVFASGSYEGFIRIWRLDPGIHAFQELFTIPSTGFVNSLQLVVRSRSEAPMIIAALGQEPRLGRWQKLEKAKNRTLVARLVLRDGTAAQ